MTDFVPPQNLFQGGCSACLSGQCLEIPPDKFDALIGAVKDRFGTWPLDEAATAFVAGWVTGNYPGNGPAILAFMRRYLDFAQDVLCDSLEI